MRIMGLDYGSKTVGVAISDPLGLTAQGIDYLQERREQASPDFGTDRRTCERI